MRWMKRQRRKGSAIVELSLMGPWIFLMFAGVLDFGFYSYALIATENAARVGALRASQDASVTNLEICRSVLGEMAALPNTKTVTSCSALPVKVDVAESTEGISPNIYTVRKVTVTYQTVQLMPIPGLTGRLTASRSVTMRVKAE